MHLNTICWTLAAVLAGCGASDPPVQSPTTGEPAPSAERKALTQTQCDAQGGTAMGDIGDGAIHRADYVCPSGKPPLGSIAPDPGGPIAVEGSVCCPK